MQQHRPHRPPQLLAAEQPKVAATLAAETAAQSPEGANYGGNTLVTVNGVTETRDQAANFADDEGDAMVFNPNDPTGPKITVAQYNQIIAKNQGATGSDTSLIATAPNVSQVVAINGVPVPNTTKPQVLGTVTTITDPTKTLATVVSQANVDLTNSTPTVTPAVTPPAKTPSNPVTDFLTSISNALAPITTPISNALAPITTPISNALNSTGQAITTAATTTATDAADAVANAEKSVTDSIAAAGQQASDSAASGTKTITDAVSQAQTDVGNLVNDAELSLSGLLTKITSTVTSIPDLTKSVLPSTTTTPSPTQTPAPDTTTTPTANPDTSVSNPPPALTLTDKVNAFLKKYGIPLVAGVGVVGAIGSLAVVMNHNSKQGIIAQ